MRLKFVLFIFFLASTITNAQSTFIRRNIVGNIQYYPQVEKAPDGGWITSLQSGNNTHLLRYDACGTKIWEKRYVSFKLGEISFLKNGNMLLSSNNYNIPEIIILDPRGNVISAKRYAGWHYVNPVYEYYVYSSGEFENGDRFFNGICHFTMAGPPSTYAYFIVKTDSNGNIKWECALSGITAWGMAIACKDGGVLARGGHLKIKTDSLGKVEWLKYYASTSRAYKPIEVSDGFIFAKYGATGFKDTSFIYKIDRSGNIKWIGDRFVANFLREPKLLPNGNILSFGSYKLDNSTYRFRPTLIETDPNGKFIQQHVYTLEQTDFGSTADMCVLDNGSTLFTDMAGNICKVGNSGMLGCGDSLITQSVPSQSFSAVDYTLAPATLSFEVQNFIPLVEDVAIEELNICSGYDPLKCPEPSTLCISSNQSLTLTAPAGYNYYWSNGSYDQSIHIDKPGFYNYTIIDPCTNQTASSYHWVVLCKDISVEENSVEFSLSIYPNPTSGSFFIHGLRITEITVLSALGKEVTKIKPNPDTSEIEVGALAKGVYFVEIRQGTNSQVKKIVIE